MFLHSYYETLDGQLVLPATGDSCRRSGEQAGTEGSHRLTLTGNSRIDSRSRDAGATYQAVGRGHGSHAPASLGHRGSETVIASCIARHATSTRPGGRKALADHGVHSCRTPRCQAGQSAAFARDARDGDVVSMLQTWPARRLAELTRYGLVSRLVPHIPATRSRMRPPDPCEALARSTGTPYRRDDLDERSGCSRAGPAHDAAPARAPALRGRGRTPSGCTVHTTAFDYRVH